MRRITSLLALALTFAPLTTFAQIATRNGGGAGVELLMKNILDFINSVLIPFIIGIGFLFFVWGMFQYFIAGGANEESREKGKSLMIHATIGFVVIIVFFGIINLLTSSTGLEGQFIQNIPTVIVPE